MKNNKVKTIFVTVISACCLWAEMSAPVDVAESIGPTWVADMGQDKPAAVMIHGSSVLVFTKSGVIRKRSLRQGALRGTVEIGSVPASTPVSKDRSVIVADTEGRVGMYDLRKGTPKWKQDIGASQFSSLTIHNGVAYFGTGSGRPGVWALRLSDGERVFSLPLEKAVLSSPVIDGNTLFAGTTAGELLAVDMGSGTVLSKELMKGGFYRQKMGMTGDALLVAPSSTHRRIESRNTGEKGGILAKKWERSFERKAYIDSDVFYQYAHFPPDQMNQRISQIVSARKGFSKRNRPFDVTRDFAATGSVQTSSWAVSGEVAAIVVRELGLPPQMLYHVLALDVSTGGALIEHTELTYGADGMSTIGPVLTEDYLVACIAGGRILCFDRTSGDLLWESSVGSNVVGDLLSDGETVVAQTADNTLVGYQLLGNQAIPDAYRFRKNTPNPFVKATMLMYEIPQTSRVTLRIFNAGGKLIRVLENTKKRPGYYRSVWDATNDQGNRVAAGTYFARIQAGSFKKSIRMTLLK